MTDNSQSEDSKIVVDEDWKDQVAREKAEQRAKERRQAREDKHKDDMPPATFEMLVSTFATQALASLGFFPDPSTGKPNVNRQLAKHFIDMLAMLDEKTAGNLSDDEKAMLDGALHQLRMAFLQPPPAAESDTSSDPEPQNPESNYLDCSLNARTRFCFNSNN
ncbi:MAG: DUF1844 domain-containing protein [Pirellulaceae bacterium]